MHVCSMLSCSFIRSEVCDGDRWLKVYVFHAGPLSAMHACTPMRQHAPLSFVSAPPPPSLRADLLTAPPPPSLHAYICRPASLRCPPQTAGTTMCSRTSGAWVWSSTAASCAARFQRYTAASQTPSGPLLRRRHHHHQSHHLGSMAAAVATTEVAAVVQQRRRVRQRGPCCWPVSAW